MLVMINLETNVVMFSQQAEVSTHHIFFFKGSHQAHHNSQQTTSAYCGYVVRFCCAYRLSIKFKKKKKKKKKKKHQLQFPI